MKGNRRFDEVKGPKVQGRLNRTSPRLSNRLTFRSRSDFLQKSNDKRPSVKVKRLAILCGRFPARRPASPPIPDSLGTSHWESPLLLPGVSRAKGHSYSCSGSPVPSVLEKMREVTLELTPSLMAMAFTVVVALRVKGSL